MDFRFDDFTQFHLTKKKILLNNINKSISGQIYKDGIKELNILLDWKKSVNEMVNQISKPNPSSFNDLKSKSRIMTRDEDMKRVNPYFKDDSAFIINCAYCSATYDLRRRGYDVEADDYHIDYFRPDEKENNIYEIYSWWTHRNSFTRVLTPDTNAKQILFNKYYPGYKFFNMSEFNSDELERILLLQGDGARGELSLVWTKGGAHSVIYEIQNGEVLLRDCQVCKVLRLRDYTDYSNKVFYFRTDNEEPTDRILNCVKNKNLDTLSLSNDGIARSFTDKLIREYRENGFDVNRDGDEIIVFLDSGHGKYLMININGTAKFVNAISNKYVDMKGL